jgi:hypothetical protein
MNYATHVGLRKGVQDDVIDMLNPWTRQVYG